MCKQKMTKEEQNMQIANCRICLLCKYHCADCPLNWALKILEIEESLKVIEIPLKIIEPGIIESTNFPGFETRIFLIETPIKIEVV